MPDAGSDGDEAVTRSTGRGFGRVLVTVYGVFALAATARSLVQIATRFDEAPVAYLLDHIVQDTSILPGAGMLEISSAILYIHKLKETFLLGSNCLRITQ